MPLDFPTSPSVGVTTTISDKTWQYNGKGWKLLPNQIQGLQGTQGITGSGSQGTQGIQGIQGRQGITGNTGGVPYVFSTTTTDADPGNGTIRYDNTVIGSVGFIFIDNNDTNSNVQTTWYDSWDDSTSTVKGYIIVQGASTGSTIVNVWRITGTVTVATGYYKIPVAHISGSIPADASPITVSFSRTGDFGTQGTQGITGAGTQGTQGITGNQGTQGITGTGTQGTQGIQGITGTQGTQGIQGITGTGTQGTQGITGNQGTQGITGTGTQGTQGIQGITGTQGTQGIQGITGTQGTQGIQGITGTQGTQGIQGISGPSTTIFATDDTTTATLYPVMVAATGSNQTAKARSTAQAFVFNASTNVLTASQLDITANAAANDSVLSLSGAPLGTNSKNGLFGIGQLSFNDTDIIANFTHNTNSYAQVILQNLNSGTTASADYIVNNDRVGGTAVYGDFGINATGFTTTVSSFGEPDGTYLYSAGGTLSIGTNDAKDFRIATGSATATPVTRMTILGTTGLIGVGTTTPTQELDINGDLRIRGGIYDSNNVVGTAGSVLISTGAGVSWSTSSSSSTITAETASANIFFPTFSNVASGTASGTYAADNKLEFQPSTGTLYATVFTSLSDQTQKKNVRPIENALELISQVQGVRYDWIDEHNKSSIGVIAQEIEKVLPEVVTTNAKGLKTVSYGNIVAVLIEAIKEQQVRIEELERKLDA